MASNSSQFGAARSQRDGRQPTLGFRVWGLGFRGVGFRVQGLGFGVWGLGFREVGRKFMKNFCQGFILVFHHKHVAGKLTPKPKATSASKQS